MSKNYAKNYETAKKMEVSQDAYYYFADAVENFENYGVKLHENFDLEEVMEYMTYPVVKVCTTLDEPLSPEDREVNVRLLESLLSLTYYCLDTFINSSRGILRKKIIQQMEPLLKQESKGIATIINKYLSFIVFTQKLKGYTEETFYEEYIRYPPNKKKELHDIYEVCMKSIRENRGNMPEIFNDDTQIKLDTYFPILPIYIRSTLYPEAQELFASASQTYNNVLSRIISAEEEKSAAILAAQEAESQKNMEDLLSSWGEEPSKVVSKNVKTKSNKKEEGAKTKKNKKEVIAKPIAPAIQPASAILNEPQDLTGFTTVGKEDMRVRYFLTNRNYYTIRMNAQNIVRPLTHLFAEGTNIVGVLRYNRTGYYFNIKSNEIPIAHISFFHYGRDQYHFKINHGNNPTFGLEPMPQEFTIPFNLHLVQNVISNSMQPVINKTSDINRTTQIVSVVKEMLDVIVHLLNNERHINAGKSGRNKRKIRRQIKTRKNKRRY